MEMINMEMINMEMINMEMINMDMINMEMIKRFLEILLNIVIGLNNDILAI